MNHPLVALLLFTALTASATEAPWRSLFNGRDLTGWKIVGAQPRAATYVEDGALTGHMVRGTPEHTFFCTEESFGDFILELECFQTGGFNTGILFRCIETPADASVRLHGYQVKIDPSPTRRWTGGIFDDYGRNWLWLYTLEHDERARSAYKFNEWARFRIEAVGRTLNVWVNGVPTAHLLHDKYTRGPIALKIPPSPRRLLIVGSRGAPSGRISVNEVPASARKSCPVRQRGLRWTFRPSARKRRNRVAGRPLFGDGDQPQLLHQRGVPCLPREIHGLAWVVLVDRRVPRQTARHPVCADPPRA